MTYMFILKCALKLVEEITGSKFCGNQLLRLKFETAQGHKLVNCYFYFIPYGMLIRLFTSNR